MTKVLGGFLLAEIVIISRYKTLNSFIYASIALGLFIACILLIPTKKSEFHTTMNAWWLVAMFCGAYGTFDYFCVIYAVIFKSRVAIFRDQEFLRFTNLRIRRINIQSIQMISVSENIFGNSNLNIELKGGRRRKIAVGLMDVAAEELRDKISHEINHV